MDIGEVLRMTVEWYRRYHDNPADIAGFSLDQLRRYCDHGQ